ncbi:pilus assembly protein PilM [Patescibacteria group bacterium]|nr:pilus assembly protein PilM [Patescibacteria group bacterium]
MLKKTFVSLYFLSDKLFVLQLDSKKKKVRKHGFFDLPEGLIQNYKVQDKKALAKILKGVWSKLGLREKSLGIVVPEFSTFTKLFDLPKLSPTELDEAVRWQAQEYLPTAIDKMILDWEIVERSENGYEVLVVAMEKTILTGFVEAAEQAGLFPLAVETPALCLVRMTDEKTSSGKLIVYKGSSECLLVVSAGRKVFGTSVLHTSDPWKIASTAAKITSHYKDVKIEKIFVSGIGVDNALIQQLEKELEIKTEQISLDIGGFSEKEVQEYLIPICMQINDLEEPSSPNSLNLLPLALVEKYKNAKKVLQTWSLTLITTLFIWVSFLITLGAYLFMTQQITDQQAINSSESKVAQQRSGAIAEVKNINDIAERVIQIKGASVLPQTVFNEINQAKPLGVSLTRYKLDLDGGKIELKGRAENRQVLLEFKKNLENSDNIASVEIPISNFEIETDLEFTLMYNYLPAVSAKSKTIKKII